MNCKPFHIICLVCCLSLLFSCSGQSTEKEIPKTDTVAYDPYPDLTELPDKIMTHNIVVLSGGYVLNFDGRTEQLSSLNELEKTLQKNLTAIQTEKLYLLTDSTVSAETVQQLIALLKKEKIDDYRVINLQQVFTPPTPVIIETPKSVSVVRNLDSNYFQIKERGKGFELYLKGTKTFAASVGEVDHFISRNKKIIQPDKVMLAIRQSSDPSLYKNLMAVLRKHNYVRFQLVTDTANNQ